MKKQQPRMDRGWHKAPGGPPNEPRVGFGWNGSVTGGGTPRGGPSLTTRIEVSAQYEDMPETKVSTERRGEWRTHKEKDAVMLEMSQVALGLLRARYRSHRWTSAS